MMYNYRMGLVQPCYNNDRIMSQIDVMSAYSQQKRNCKLKLILRVVNFNFNNWVAGREQLVRDQCPITNCWMTVDQSLARDDDALLISEFYDSTQPSPSLSDRSGSPSTGSRYYTTYRPQGSARPHQVDGIISS